MALQLEERPRSRIMEVHATGRLASKDYDHFIPEFERFITEHGKVRLMFEMTDFHGWNIGALWEDIKFDFKHFSDIERLAMVGDKKWEKAMSMFCRPFTTAEIRYFDRAAIDEARAWLESD